jgi:predicted ArsR family transcriptional regulator
MVLMKPGPELDRRISAVAALDQPLRRALHRLLADRGWHGRDEAAAALEVPRSVAAFHLDRLAEAGVVEVRYERTSGRQGPGAGRPAKLYRLVGGEVAVSIPERRYDLAGSLLAAAVAESNRTGRPARECLHDAAREAGRALGEEARDGVHDLRRVGERRDAVMAVLADHGYEPALGRGNEIGVANCPFHRLAEQERDLVCGMNLEFVSGLLAGLGTDDRLGARSAPSAPARGGCCVRIGTA